MGESRRSLKSNKKGSTPVVVGGIVVAVIVAFVIAMVTGGGSDSAGSSTSTAGGSVDPGASGENQPVVVDGQILDPLPESGADLSIGADAPGLSGSAFDGSPVSVTPGDGKEYMVVFLAHWCPHCNREVPRLIEWKASGAIPEGLTIVGVSTAVASDRPNYPPSQWVVDKGWPWPVMADSENMEAAEAYGVSGFPFFTIVGGDGKVKLRASGEVEVADLTRMVNEALAD